MNRTRIAWDTQLGMMVAGITVTSLGPARPFLIAEHGLSLTLAGTVFAFFSGSRTATVLLSTVIADRLPRKPMLLVAHGGFAVGLLTFALAPAFLLHLAAIAVAGAGFGFTDAISNAVVAEVFPERRGFALNRLHAFFGLGCVIGPAFTSILFAAGGHWRIAFAFAGAIAAAVTTLTALTDIPGKPAGAGDATSASRATLLFLTTRGLILPAIVVLLFTGVSHGLIGWLNTYFGDVLGASAAAATVVLLCYNAGITLGRIACSAYADRLGFRTTIVLNSGAGAAVLVLAAATRSPLVAAAGYTLGGFFLAGIAPTAVAIATSHAPTRTGETAARMFVFGAAGSFLVPFSMGVVGDWLGIASGIAFAVVLVAIIAGTALALPRRRRYA